MARHYDAVCATGETIATVRALATEGESLATLTAKVRLAGHTGEWSAVYRDTARDNERAATARRNERGYAGW